MWTPGTVNSISWLRISLLQLMVVNQLFLVGVGGKHNAKILQVRHEYTLFESVGFQCQALLTFSLEGFCHCCAFTHACLNVQPAQCSFYISFWCLFFLILYCPYS